MNKVLNQYNKKILHILLDKYEASKSFNNSNKVNQKFSVQIDKLFPKYKNDADYETFVEVNEAIEDIVSRKFIKILSQRNNVIDTVGLEIEFLTSIYSELGREPKREEFAKLYDILNEYQLEDSLLGIYAKEQIKRINANKNVEGYGGNIEEFKDVLKVAKSILNNQKEVFIRDLSIRLFGDSKRLENLKGKIQGLLFKYGRFEEKDFILEECGVVSTPTYVMLKGNGTLKFQDQQIDLRSIGSDIGLSTKTLELLEEIEIHGSCIITVENLTSFYDYPIKDEFVIYLGGFHNKVKTQLLKMIYEYNSDKRYLHFGDIDIGGFYIFHHLCMKTKIPFELLYMDIDILEKYKQLWKPLTENDKKRMIKLKECISREDSELQDAQKEKILGVLDYMSAHKCKLEQEALS